MKTHFVRTTAYCFVLLSGILSAGCREDAFLSEQITTEKIADSTRSAKFGIPTKFEQVEMARKIEAYMEPLVAGFGYTIYNDGVEYYGTNGGDGWARKKVDSPFQFHGAIIKQEISKVTQYVTAVAVIRALEKHGLSLGSAVWPYLPKSWNPSTKFKTLTFERLLAHRTGLINYNDLQKLSLTVSGNVNEGIYTSKDFQNNDVNYLLLGIILPYLEAKKLAQQGNSSKLNKLDQINNNFIEYGEQFRAFVRTNVFQPAGLSNSSVIDWRAWDQNGTILSSLSNKGYPTKNGDEPGTNKEVHLSDCGVSGLYMSADQFAKLQSAVAQFKVISFDNLKLMKSKLLGFDGSISGNKGIYHWKKGEENNCEAMIVDFGKVQVAVFATSTHSQITNPAVIAQMYEASFVSL
ncbi:serine hydrolase domain-containing protein [Dyadobacter aurulentus]|uniref:hypothetical protein n=1 Tax=Dyadobacter sp. UC 10 TaxID=2605428 RepID=UPI0011F0B3EA|nr:hypothetical protein [Dyadobacter sp. UC 10]KAA0992132.1 hypothetical protein FXO21_19090 [Dyadobacter sp. UC 10]